MVEATHKLAKLIARTGACSRREAEAAIVAGRVQVDDEAITSVARRFPPDARIAIDGQPLRQPAYGLWRYHKPRGVLVARKDSQGRTLFTEHLPSHLRTLSPIGRLDINSEGLLLLTNHGGWKRHMEHPANAWERTYRVRALGRVKAKTLTALGHGITIEGVRYRGLTATLEQASTGHNRWYRVVLREGKNREIRVIFAHLGLVVNRLIRQSFGPFALEKLPPGSVESAPIPPNLLPPDAS